MSEVSKMTEIVTEIGIDIMTTVVIVVGVLPQVETVDNAVVVVVAAGSATGETGTEIETTMMIGGEGTETNSTIEEDMEAAATMLQETNRPRGRFQALPS
ncbi:unnamed protein product [Symbiodinium microadriaticum]|nr:unnamed protein product [Symbiodinium microadriaticum]